jgi:hypothetical protein
VTSVFVDSYIVDWIGEGADVPRWLSDRLPLSISAFGAQWGGTFTGDNSLMAFWSNNVDQFAIFGPRHNWQLGDETPSAVIYWGHGCPDIGELLSGKCTGINYIRKLIEEQKIDGSSPCSIYRKKSNSVA